MSQELLNIPSDSLGVPEIKHQHARKGLCSKGWV